MNITKLEIQKGGRWFEVKLQRNGSIRYNRVINRIGNIATREISHSNTFVLPWNHQNINILELNIFNSEQLATSLNIKYPSRFFINEKLSQEGFLVINNIDEGSIKVNFIDGALSIVDSWNNTTYRELLQSDILNIPTDYSVAIEEMRSYIMNKTVVLPQLSNIGSRGYKISLFPNNLNTIGDKFQKDDSEQRVIDTFNPYQSRPIFNSQAFFDLIIESYGFTPNYDNSINWSEIELTYIAPKDTLKNEDSTEIVEVKVHPTISLASEYYNQEVILNSAWEIWNVFEFGSSNTQARQPSSINVWQNPPDNQRPGYEDRYCIYSPNIDNSFDGYVQLNCDVSGLNSDASSDFKLYSTWYNLADDGIIYDEITHIDNSTNSTLDLRINKSEFITVPIGADPDRLIGIFVTIGSISTIDEDGYILQNLITEEESKLAAGVTYDDFGQYVPDSVDLTYIAPDISLKNILSSLMNVKGMLIDIDNKTKNIYLFTYGSYLDKRDSGEFNDWSNYLVEYGSPKFNTNYGNDYGVVNVLGLKQPYLGNTFKKSLSNQGKNTKYKPLVENFDNNFSDIISVKEVQNTTPFLEFETKDISLVEDSGLETTSLDQVRSDGTNQGIITPLPKITNVNMENIPNGRNEWYNIVDNEVKANEFFLIPTSVFLQFDIKKPIYLRQRGGYFIVEEIREYVNGENQVEISLIKLSDKMRT